MAATAPEARQRLHEAMARAETARRAMVDPAIEKYRAATAGELAAYNTFLAALAPGEDHTPGLERFRSATAPALAELRAVEAEAHAAYHAVVRPIEAELAGLIGPVEQWPRGAVAANALADAPGARLIRGAPMPREQVRNAVTCPVCGARPGSLCRIAGKLTAAVHVKGRGLAEADIGWTRPGLTMRQRSRAHQWWWRAVP